MSDEHFEEINEIAFPTPEHAALYSESIHNSQLSSKQRLQNLRPLAKSLPIVKLISEQTTTKSNSSHVTEVIKKSLSLAPGFFLFIIAREKVVKTL